LRSPGVYMPLNGLVSRSFNAPPKFS